MEKIHSFIREGQGPDRGTVPPWTGDHSEAPPRLTRLQMPPRSNQPLVDSHLPERFKELMSAKSRSPAKQRHGHESEHRPPACQGWTLLAGRSGCKAEAAPGPEGRGWGRSREAAQPRQPHLSDTLHILTSASFALYFCAAGDADDSVPPAPDHRKWKWDTVRMMRRPPPERSGRGRTKDDGAFSRARRGTATQVLGLVFPLQPPPPNCSHQRERRTPKTSSSDLCLSLSRLFIPTSTHANTPTSTEPPFPLYVLKSCFQGPAADMPPPPGSLSGP